MREDDGGRIVLQRTAYHLARVNAGLREGAAEQLLVVDESVLSVEEQHRENLVLQASNPQGKVVAYLVR